MPGLLCKLLQGTLARSVFLVFCFYPLALTFKKLSSSFPLTRFFMRFCVFSHISW